MNIRIFQRGFNFSQDGPGNRLVYHLSGCNIHCPWCSNPEGFDRNSSTVYTVDALTEEVLRSRMMFFDGGGVTLTGGEVTVQLDSAKELLTRLHAAGINTCIETNGICERLPELFDVLDLLIMDIKHYDPAFHKKVTGLSNEITVNNISEAIRKHQPLNLRIPLIGGFNTSDQDAKGFVRLFRDLQLPADVPLELLPYHEFGRAKYEKLGMLYPMDDGAKVSSKQLHSFRRVLESAGFMTIVT